MTTLARADERPRRREPPTTVRNPVKVSLGLGRHSVGMLVASGSAASRSMRCFLPTLAMSFRRLTPTGPTLTDGWPRWATPITVVKNASPIAGDASLSAECHRKSVLPSPAYGGKSCSLKWKVEPQRKWVAAWPLAREAWARGGEVMNLIGYDDSPKERLRAARGQAKWPAGHHNRYPLQEWGWLLEDCLSAILRAGLPIPPKSACWHCPNAKKPEIIRLAQEHPDLARQCLVLEARAKARGLRTVAGLGRRFAWSDYLASEGIAL